MKFYEHTVCKSAGTLCTISGPISISRYMNSARGSIHDSHPFRGVGAALLIPEECWIRLPRHSLCFRSGQCRLRKRQERQSYEIHLHEYQPARTETGKQDKSPRRNPEDPRRLLQRVDRVSPRRQVASQKARLDASQCRGKHSAPIKFPIKLEAGNAPAKTALVPPFSLMFSDGNHC